VLLCCCYEQAYRLTSENPDDGREVNDAPVTPASIIIAAAHCLTQNPDQQNDDEHNTDHLQYQCNDCNYAARYQPRYTQHRLQL